MTDSTTDLRLWRRGDTPQTETRVDLTTFSDDFELVAENIQPGQCVALSGAFRARTLPGERAVFTFMGRDGRKHAVTIDPSEIAIGDDAPNHTDLPEIGMFLPDNGRPIAFGGKGQPSLAKLLTDPQAPDGSYQIVGDDSEPEVRDLAFNPPDDIRFPDTGGLITCLPRCATVLTDRNEIHAARLHPGDRVLTRDHGFQPVDWTSAEQGDGEMVYIATRQGVLQAADAPTAKFLILSHRFANQSR